MKTPLFQKIDCLNLRVGDLEAALRFYDERLGHRLLWRTEQAAGMRLANSVAELVLHTDDHPTETDLTVESVPDAIQAFVSAGGKLVAGPFEIQIGLCAIIEDPWRNQLTILDNSKGLLNVDANKNVIG
jgi:predicted enzyme related to lactoylglutathione lyase